MSRPRRAASRFFSCRTRAALRRVRDAGDEGFTLIELALVMIIMPLVLGVLFYALFVTLESEAHVSTKVADSVDSQISSEFYVRDVQSATLVTLSTSAKAPTICGTGTKMLVSLAWPSGSTSTGKTVVSYWIESGGTTLVRQACKTGPARPSTTTSRNFSSAISRAIVACVAGKPKCATPTTPASATHTWVPAQWVSAVTVAVAQVKGKYRYDLSATPRVSNANGSILGTLTIKTLPTLFLLGTKGRDIREDASGTTVRVEGTTAITAGGHIFQTGGTVFKTTKGETTGTPAVICKTGTKTTCNPPPTFTPPLTQWAQVPSIRDPLATLPDPLVEALGSTNGCPSSTVTTLSPGRYTCPIKPQPGTTLVLQHGAYEFEKTVTLKNASLTGESGVFIYFPCYPVDKWDTAHLCTEGLATAGGGQTTSIKVNAMSSGLYKKIWYWQNAGDISTVAIHAKTKLSITGIMYVPNAAVSINGGGRSTAVGAVVAYTLDLKNGTFLITGF